MTATPFLRDGLGFLRGVFKSRELEVFCLSSVFCLGRLKSRACPYEASSFWGLGARFPPRFGTILDLVMVLYCSRVWRVSRRLWLMARQRLVSRCPECDVHIGHHFARTCSKCGAQLYHPRRSLLGWFFVWLFFLFNGWILVRLYFTAQTLFRTYSTVSSPGGLGSVGGGYTLSDSSTMLLNLFFEWVIGIFFIGMLILMTKARVKL